jgi:hypothetical protein
MPGHRLALLTLLIVAFTLVACGPSAEDKWWAAHRELERDCPKAGPGWRVANSVDNYCEWREEWMTPEQRKVREDEREWNRGLANSNAPPQPYKPPSPQDQERQRDDEKIERLLRSHQ